MRPVGYDVLLVLWAKIPYSRLGHLPSRVSGRAQSLRAKLPRPFFVEAFLQGFAGLVLCASWATYPARLSSSASFKMDKFFESAFDSVKSSFDSFSTSFTEFTDTLSETFTPNFQGNKDTHVTVTKQTHLMGVDTK